MSSKIRIMSLRTLPVKKYGVFSWNWMAPRISASTPMALSSFRMSWNSSNTTHVRPPADSFSSVAITAPSESGSAAARESTVMVVDPSRGSIARAGRSRNANCTAFRRNGRSSDARAMPFMARAQNSRRDLT